MTTNETTARVTTNQIKQLREEAAAAGDQEQVDICDVALGDRWDRYSAVEGTPSIDAQMEMQEKARATCAWVIADAEARRQG